ncbi:uncharacterized protein LOC127862886 isoform X1 [Dreissena polymorpha]|nr:uncharacterized protein LOC127862886 isoform X1 [Dreissena polymorpha]
MATIATIVSVCAYLAIKKDARVTNGPDQTMLMSNIQLNPEERIDEHSHEISRLPSASTADAHAVTNILVVPGSNQRNTISSIDHYDDVARTPSTEMGTIHFITTPTAMAHYENIPPMSSTNMVNISRDDNSPIEGDIRTEDGVPTSKYNAVIRKAQKPNVFMALAEISSFCDSVPHAERREIVYRQRTEMESGRYEDLGQTEGNEQSQYSTLGK